MELLFKRLTLKDFRIYAGEHSIDFSTDSNQHLTVVHAENSVGKTTMLNAIKWCLYGITPDFTADSALVNDRSKKNICSVRLNFIYNNTEFSALRTYEQLTRKDKLVLNEISASSGAQKPIDEPESAINNILPKDLSNYFLFAGEHFTGALGTGDRISHRRAIRDILGFTLPELALVDIDYLIKRNKRALIRLLQEEEGTEAIAREIELLDNDIEELDKTISKVEEEIRSYQEIKTLSQRKIEESNHHKARALNNQRRDKDAQLFDVRNREKILLTQSQGLIAKHGYILFGKKLTDTSLDFIKTEKRRIPAPYDQKFVNELLDDQECICGRKLEVNSIEYNAVKSMVSSANTAVIDQRAQKAISIGDSFNQRADEFLDEINRIEIEIKVNNLKIEGLERTIIQIDNDIQAIGNIDISTYQNAVRNAEKEVLSKTELLGVTRSRRSVKQDRLRSLNVEITRTKVNNNALKELEEFDVCAKEVSKRIEKRLNETEKKALVLIQHNVQKNLDESLRKPFKLILDENYNFLLKDEKTGRILKGADGGRGQTLLSNLSFVTALIAYSKKRSKSKSTLFQPGTIAPFVIDAPFAEMDRSYQKNTLEFLPKQSHQLILFLSTGQWHDDFENIIGKYIGKRYLLINHGESESGEVESITIKGKSHQLSVFDSNIDSPPTTIKEI
jgi:DNA sulfur modification protein DndD